MTTLFFNLPPEIRFQVYSYVFAGSNSILAFTPPQLEVQADSPKNLPDRGSATMFSKGHLEFLRVSKQSYKDSIDSYHAARSLRIRNLNQDNLHELAAMKSLHTMARMVTLEGLKINDFSPFPCFPKLHRLDIEDIQLWGGNRSVEKGSTPAHVFSDADILASLLDHPKYLSLKIANHHSAHFPDACITINFLIGYSVIDKNIMRGVQDWYWRCLYTVNTGALEKRLSHRLSLW